MQVWKDGVITVDRKQIAGIVSDSNPTILIEGSPLVGAKATSADGIDQISRLLLKLPN